MWNAAKWSLASLFLALVIALSGVVGHEIGSGSGDGTARPAPVRDAGDDYAVLDEICRILEEDFVNPAAVDCDELRDGAISGFIGRLGDPHTVYIDPESYERGLDIISGTFEGIGAQVDQNPLTGEIVIVTPFRGSPAEEAGLVPGDVILAVDGESTAGWTIDQAVNRIRGEQGTPVELTIRRADGSTEDVTIVRSTITIPTVFVDEVRDEDGTLIPELVYVEIQQFTEQTVRDLRNELQRIQDEGYSGLILDLRRNPGGGLDSTIAVADLFLDEGVILTQEDRDGNRTDFNARPGGEGVDIPMVVLVGPGSASGSEVVAGALRDHGRATLIGENTFGKGSVNHLRPLSNGGALYVTIARWLTPNGEQIEAVGLRPDVVVEPSEEELFTRVGPQLHTAIDHLQGQLQAAAR
jgi:carboxyl-terminal processing protease